MKAVRWHGVEDVRLCALRDMAAADDCPHVKFDGREPTQHANRHRQFEQWRNAFVVR